MNDNMGVSAVLFLVLGDLLEVFGERNLEAMLIMLVETVVLKRVEGNGGLHHVLEINKTKQILPPTLSCLLDQPDALVARKRSENIYLPTLLRLTSRSDASLGIPSTYRLLVASLGMWNRAIDWLGWYICCPPNGAGLYPPSYDGRLDPIMW